MKGRGMSDESEKMLLVLFIPHPLMHPSSLKNYAIYHRHR